MKPSRLLFLLLTVSAATSMQQRSYAASPQQSSTQTSAGPDGNRSQDAEPTSPAGNANHEKAGSVSDESQPARPAFGRNRSRSHTLPAAPSKNKIPLPRKRSSGKSANLQSARSENSGSAGKARVVQSQTASNIPAVRPTSAVRPTGTSQRPSFDTARHHGPNPPVVAGSPSSGHSNTGVINGTTMHLKR
jgi:hypothetical protein